MKLTQTLLKTVIAFGIAAPLGFRSGGIPEGFVQRPPGALQARADSGRRSTVRRREQLQRRQAHDAFVPERSWRAAQHAALLTATGTTGGGRRAPARCKFQRLLRV